MNLIEKQIKYSTDDIAKAIALAFSNGNKNTIDRHYQNVKKVSEWMEEQLDGRFYFRDITDDYSNERIEMELRKCSVVYKCDAFAYDTAKASGMDDWKELKKCITNIVELAKQLHLTGICTFQLSDNISAV